MQERGEWHSMEHAHYGIVIDTQIPVPESYTDLEAHARQIAEVFSNIVEWYRA
jgi:hypothetical protein